MTKISLKQIRLTIVILALVIFSGGVGFYLGENKAGITFNGIRPQVNINRGLPSNRSDVDFSMFWDVWDKLDSSYIDQSALDKQKMVYGAISGMVAALGDPYTVFLPPQDQKNSRDDLAGSFEGVGIQLGFKDSRVSVMSPLSGSPAEKAGVLPGDFINKIVDKSKNIDKDTSGMSLPEAVELIRGPKGTKITLELQREGKDAPFQVELVRDTIVVKSVELTINDKAAVLKLTKFGERTYDEWDEAVKQIDEKRKTGEVKGVVLDLRNNPGGFLQGAVYIGGEFLKNGVIVKQEEAGKEIKSFTVDRKGLLTDIPLTVLINKGSASASEIVAGALQERGRAKLVGETSFGKGTIQTAEELGNGAGLHITIARWLLPSGKNVNKTGVKPDLEVKMAEIDQASIGAEQPKDTQLEKAIEVVLK